jgi:hypothetical protein
MMRDAPSTAGSRWLFSVGVAILLAGCTFTGVLWVAWQRAEETRSWQELPCQILSSQIQQLQKTPHSPTVFSVEVKYTYMVDGKTYTSQRIRRVDGPTGDAGKAQNLRQQFSPGQQTVCYVKPGEPEFAILRQGSRGALYAIWFPLLFVVGGGGMAWHARRKKSHA